MFLPGQQQTPPTAYHKVSMMEHCGPCDSLTLEDVMDRIPVGYFQYRLLFMCGLAFMADALEVTLLSFLTACVGADWNLSNAEKATLTGMVFLGIVLGSLFFGHFADVYGRRKSYLYSCLLISCGGLLSAVSPSFLLLIAFRMLTGFGIGGSSVPFDLLAEFLPESHRGKFLVFMQLFWTVGSMLVAAVAWAALPTLGWRFLTLVCVLPVLFISLYSYYYLPESPRWLLTQGREREAAQILHDAAVVNNVHLPELHLVNKSQTVESEGSYFDLVRTAAARRITLPLWTIWGLFGFTYFGLILFQSRVYSNQDAVAESESDSAKCEFDYGPIFFNAASESLAVLVSIALIDQLGRVRSQAVFYTIGGVAVIAMGVGVSPNVVLFFSIIARMCAMSSSLSTWVATPELFPTELRATGHSSCASISKLCSFCAPYIVTSTMSYASVGVIPGLMNFAAAGMAFALPSAVPGALSDASIVAQDDESSLEMAKLKLPHCDSSDLLIDKDGAEVHAGTKFSNNAYAKVQTEASTHGSHATSNPIRGEEDTKIYGDNVI